MKRSKFSEQQIAFILRQVEEGVPIGEVCRKVGISEQTYYRCVRDMEGVCMFVWIGADLY